MSRNFKDVVKEFQHALNISYQNTRNIVKVSERYLAELAEAEQGGGGGSIDYSTDEVEVGTWIDGSKLYKRTFTGLSIAMNADSWVYYATPDYIKDIIDLNAYYVSDGVMGRCAISEYKASDTHGIMMSGFTGFNRTITTINVLYTKVSA